MADKTCKIEGCPLTPALPFLEDSLPVGAKPKLCWQHQPQDVTDRLRAERAARYKAWFLSTQPFRREFYALSEKTQELVK